MKLIAIALLGALATPALFSSSPRAANAAPAASEAEKYQVDSVHSTALFRVKHLDVSWAHGRFNDVSGSFEWDEKNPAASKVEVEIKVGSVDTNAGDRDKHLLGPDFFNAAEFKTMSFKSKSVKKGANGKLEIAGDMTMHGVTKPLSVEAEFVGRSKTVMGVKAGFETSFTIKREDFGMNNMLDLLGNEVRVTVSLEGDLKTDE